MAELVGFIEALNQYQSRLDFNEPAKPDVELDRYPHVDVLIATYNEDMELLRKTINGCKNMDYPDKNKVHIYLCDDKNRWQIRSLAKEMQIGYITRKEPVDAKAGNYNNALLFTDSPLIATFDADMIPMHDFLMALVPFFFLEETIHKKIGFIQSPQSFYNLDLFQYNLFSETTVPNEQDFFFRHVQLIRNKNNSAIYTGSNTILSREALEKAGGFYTKVITEDLATGLAIQSAGFQCYATASVHANGLAPTDLDNLFKQRERWARGCIQTFRKMKVFRRKGLSLSQKHSYFMALVYWYTPMRRFIFIMAPILYVLFHVTLLKASFGEILLIWLPYALLYNKALSSLTGRIRISRLSNIYDTILFPHLLFTIMLETLGIEKRSFHVTGKDKVSVSLSYKIRTIIPHLLLIVLSSASIIMCLYHWLLSGSSKFMFILFWLLVNLYNLLMAVFFVLGRKSYRTSERIKVILPLTIKYNKEILTTSTFDLSEGGISVLFDFPVYIPVDQNLDITIQNEDSRYCCSLSGKIVHITELKSKWNYAISFTSVSSENLLILYHILYDRIPVHPKKVASQSSFYDDFTRNLHSRGQKNIFSTRKLPRISLQTVLFTTEGKPVTLINFNYEFAFFKLTQVKLYTMTVVIDQEQNLVMECILNDDKKAGCLYKILNSETLAKNPLFLNYLNVWMQEYQANKKTLSMPQKYSTPRDEFTDMDFIKDDYVEMDSSKI
ncbi:glycosyltransferase [Anaeromicropila populeti]|uniref:glycosyltransferase n=1 Tax=Anaeromicropila populeti TaxID=37658 RepID=UPI0015A61B4D|nr:glycosyltransferase [Anaeromicropila populeti]